MKKIRDLPEHERPREKLLATGAQALNDEELLAILIGKGTRNLDVLALSKRLIKVIDGMGDTLKVEDLMALEGVGMAKAALIAASSEFFRRRIRPENVKIQVPSDVVPLIRHYANRKQEHFLTDL